MFAMSACSLFILASCSKMGPLSADNFVVEPNPLESQAGKVPVKINGNFPEKYMKKKAVVTVTPELRFNGQTVQGQSQTFQGEKVLGNNQTISYRVGGRYLMNNSFDYVPQMQKSDLYLTFNAKVGSKTVDIPAVKVATGVIATSELYKNVMFSNGGIIAPDTFKRVNEMKQEASIKFLINQAQLRKSELKNNSVTEFVQMLKKINADREGLNVRNVEVQAYASPEGGFEYNDKLANKRQDVSEDYVKQQLKATKVDSKVDAHYTAQDWEGFQQLVSASDLQDKEVILRVLSMYKDPEEREMQIRNMSAAFQELADGILPELRRSRLIINYETIGRSDDQIKEQYALDASKLSVDELLYSATLDGNEANKEQIYKKTTTLYPDDYRAYNNLASLALEKGDLGLANTYLNMALAKNSSAPEVLANKGMISLKEGNVEEAETSIAKATGSTDVNLALGNLALAKGNYSQAAEYLKGTKTNSEALAQLLNKNYAASAATLDKVENPDAWTSYIHAIVTARQGNKYATQSHLNDAQKKDPSLSSYADNDLELSILK